MKNPDKMSTRELRVVAKRAKEVLRCSAAGGWDLQDAYAKLRRAFELDEAEAVYGWCPTCGARGYARERRPDGNDTCINEHTYPSRDALKTREAARAQAQFYEDPTPWCHVCGAREKAQCDCGPIAENR